MTDHREELFMEFKESHARLEDVKSRIREQSALLESMHTEASEIEKEYDFLRRVVNLNITEDMDPVLAKFRVSEEQRSNPIGKSSGLSSVPSLRVISEDVKRSKVKRMLRAIKEIWND